MLRTVLVVVLFRHVVLRHFVRAHFALVRVRSVFHSAHYPRFERLSFLQQFVRAFRVGALNHGNAAKSPSAISRDRKSTRLNSSHPSISYAVFCLKKKNENQERSFVMLHAEAAQPVQMPHTSA